MTCNPVTERNAQLVTPPGLLNGDPIGTVDTSIGDDEVIQRQAMLPSSFECVACRLKISGFFKLSACGMGNASPRLILHNN